MYHPTLNSKSSTEILDPPFFTSESTLPDFQNYCPDGRICSFADAVLMKWDVASGVQQGQVAAAGLNTTTVNGRYTVDDVEDPYQGEIVQKTGAVTGRTSGEVLYPCAMATYHFGNKTLLCQGVADYGDADGDSGGAVFVLTGGSSVSAVGIHYAHSGNGLSFFSPMSSILNLFYDVSSGSYYMDPISGLTSEPGIPAVYNPPSAYASISGSSTSGYNMSCQFFAGTDISDASYEWWVDGDLIGTDASASYTSLTSSYTIELYVWSETTGASAWASHDVEVDEETQSCWAQ
jgi:hypothetical protein